MWEGRGCFNGMFRSCWELTFVAWRRRELASSSWHMVIIIYIQWRVWEKLDWSRTEGATSSRFACWRNLSGKRTMPRGTSGQSVFRVLPMEKSIPLDWPLTKEGTEDGDINCISVLCPFAWIGWEISGREYMSTYYTPRSSQKILFLVPKKYLVFDLTLPYKYYMM